VNDIDINIATKNNDVNVANIELAAMLAGSV
jgi:hypothetical protein